MMDYPIHTCIDAKKYGLVLFVLFGIASPNWNKMSAYQSLDAGFTCMQNEKRFIHRNFQRMRM